VVANWVRKVAHVMVARLRRAVSYRASPLVTDRDSRLLAAVVLIAGAILALPVLGLSPPYRIPPQPAHGIAGSSLLDSRAALVRSADVLTPSVWLPWVGTDGCDPRVLFEHIPPYGSFEDLEGRIQCVHPGENGIAVYVFVSGWWTKPLWDSPVTPIRSDGTWSCDITTGGADHLATRIAAFLVPEDYDPPLADGIQTLPPDLCENALDHVTVDRGPEERTLEFSGFTWRVKASEIPVGPGPNLFSNDEDDVWVDGRGRLHLRIARRGDAWYCTEVITERPLGHGTYTFTLASRVDELDPNAVLGLFTWDDDAPEFNYREIDIEFSSWGAEGGDNSQYVVQPWQNPDNIHRFETRLRGEHSTHAFTWGSDRVLFSSFHDREASLDPANRIERWEYVGADNPPAGDGNARINLWLFRGDPPVDGRDIEVVVDSFAFTP